MNIALWKGVVDYFKIEIVRFMIDTSHKFAVNNTDIKIQEGVLLELHALPSSSNVRSYISLYIYIAMSPKYLKFTVQISSKYLQLYDNNFAIV